MAHKKAVFGAYRSTSGATPDLSRDTFLVEISVPYPADEYFLVIGYSE
jgi:hypothetical protein